VRTSSGNPVARLAARVGRGTARSLDDLGFGGSLLAESVYWIFLGRRRKQPVRVPATFAQMMEIGIRALPIVSVLAAAVGIMLAMQGIHTLRTFGAESQVVIGIGLSVTREFAPLITGILVAGRSGSALAARLASMTLSQEIDALRVIGIAPVRYLIAPALVAMLVMLPLLTFWTDVVALLAAGLWVSAELGTPLLVYADRLLDVIGTEDLLHGLSKSGVFAVLITVVGAVNGASVSGGAEGLGRMTTRAVVQAISAIVIADMTYVFLTTR